MKKALNFLLPLLLAVPSRALASETGRQLLWNGPSATAGGGAPDGLVRGLWAIGGLLALLLLGCAWCRSGSEGDHDEPR